jgi:P pilus assembly chaperone PapD
MGRRFSQYLRSLGDNGRPRVVFVFDDEEVPVDAEHVFRLNLKGRPVAERPEAAAGAPEAIEDGTG